MFEERVLLGDGRRLECAFETPSRYVLRLLQGPQARVEYFNDGKGHRLRTRGRESAYDFKSVEQLRYDFERDAEDAQRQG